MKRLKVNQLGPWCSFCDLNTRNKAVFRQDGFSGKFACEAHRQNLIDYEELQYKADHLTEADSQTWMRL